MFQTKESKIALFRSLVASTIFLVFLRPILEFLWRILVFISSHTYSYFIDSVYENAALGQRNWIDFIFLTMSLVLLVSILGTTTYFLRKRYSILELKDYITKEKNEERKSQLIEKLSKKLNQADKTYRLGKALLKRVIIVEILTLITIFIFLFTAYADLQLNTSFNQRLTSLAPYITDNQYKVLKSKWSLMTSRKDFESLNQEMEELAKQNNIKLPRNLLK
jgi:hypothetical protein